MLLELQIILKQYVLNIKHFFNEPIKMCLIIFISILISLSIPVFFFPAFGSIGRSFLIIETIIIGLVFSSIYYDFKNTTLNKNLNLINNDKIAFNFSLFFVILTLSLMITFFMYIFILILNSFQLFLIGFRQYSSSEVNGVTYKFGIDFLFLMFYCAIIESFFMFSFSLLISLFLKSKSSYFSMIFCLVILALIYGGRINDYFQLTEEGIVANKDNDFSWVFFWSSLIVPFPSIGTLVDKGVELSMWVQVSPNEFEHTVTNYENNYGAYFYFLTHDHMLEILKKFNDGSIEWKIFSNIPLFQILFYIFTWYFISKMKYYSKF